MSSLANRVWTQEREDTASLLVHAAYECDDIEFEAIMDDLAKRPVDLFAIATILAGRLAQLAHDLQGNPE